MTDLYQHFQVIFFIWLQDLILYKKSQSEILQVNRYTIMLSIKINITVKYVLHNAYHSPKNTLHDKNRKQ